MSGSVVAFIFARGGSKGVKRKNLRSLAGKPLIAHAIEAAKAAEGIDAVVVSTEDEEIAAVAREYGAEVPFIRPEELAQDQSPEWLAWQHAIRAWQQVTGRKLAVFISVPATAPLRRPEDVKAVLDTLLHSAADLVITVKAAERSPYFNMVRLDDAGYARLVIDDQRISRRQDAPPMFDVTTVAYAARPEFILSHSSIFEGRVKTVEVPSERAIDIDTELDFKFAEFLMTERGQ